MYVSLLLFAHTCVFTFCSVIVQMYVNISLSIFYFGKKGQLGYSSVTPPTHKNI